MLHCMCAFKAVILVLSRVACQRMKRQGQKFVRDRNPTMGCSITLGSTLTLG